VIKTFFKENIMEKMKKTWYSQLARNAALYGAIALFSFAALSCEQEPDEDPTADDTTIISYLSETHGVVNVDYSGANRAVFVDFSTGKVTSLRHDFFDVAMCANGSLIANSGSYGSGVTVYDTGDDTDITDDFTDSEDDVKEYTFKTGTDLKSNQSEANPLATLETPNVPSNVYLIKVQYGDDDPQYFKVVFNLVMGQSQSYNMTVVPGLGAGETGKVELSATPITGISGAGGFGYFYFKLVGGPRLLNNATSLKAGSPGIPLAVEWDILCTRTDELTGVPQMPLAGRSSILINTYKSVTAVKVADKALSEVTTSPPGSYEFSSIIDAIGYSWYNSPGQSTPASPKTNTYIVKTAEAKYAKFQPTSFYGPAGESFYMEFEYEYPFE
jgi:hypothetical protein